MISIPMRVQTDPVSIPMAVGSLDASVGMGVGVAVEIVQTNPYEGPYTFTPGQEAVVIRTADRYLAEDITVEPVPSNYGLITWNGAFLTVS